MSIPYKGQTPPGQSGRKFQDDATLNHKRQILLRIRCTVSHSLLFSPPVSALCRPQQPRFPSTGAPSGIRLPGTLAPCSILYGVVSAVNLAPFGWGLVTMHCASMASEPTIGGPLS